jgi:hypothetical protein
VKWVVFLFLVLVSLVLGGASAIGGMALVGGNQVRLGAWTTSPAIGATSADPYTRGATALWGILALNREEAIYLTSFRDDAGEPLQPNCIYRVSGGAMPARWWSITAYGPNHMMIDNAADRYSFTQENVAVDAAGLWSFRLAAEPIAEDVLPLGSLPGASLGMRLYNPAPEALSDLSTIPAPSITKVSCS